MASLLSIPQELRDFILEYVILSHQHEAPSLNQSFDNLVGQREVLKSPSLSAWTRTVLYEPTSVVPNANSLLRVNHQIHQECLKILKRPAAQQCDVDVIILDEILPLPTWLRVPPVTTSLDAVNVTFRIAGKYMYEKERNDDGLETPYRRFGSYKGFRGGCGAGPAMDWQIYSILERFIKAGPVGKLGDECAGLHRHMTVKTLNIDVLTPADVDPAIFGRFPRSLGLEYPSQKNVDTVLDPKYLVKSIARNIGGLLGSGNHEWFNYGKILYEHVDFVVITHDGVEFSRYDVAERLRDVGGFEERYISKQALVDYKIGAWARKKERGLRVLDD